MDPMLADLIGPTSPVSAPPGGKSRLPRPGTPAAPESASAAVVSEGELSDLLGITTRRIRALVDDGILKRLTPGRYALSEVRSYCNFLREGGSRRTAQDDPLKVEKTRQARAAAEKLELQNAALRGDLLPRGDVERAWSDVLRDVRAQMLALPSRCGATLPHLTPHDVATIDGEVRSILETLANDD